MSLLPTTSRHLLKPHLPASVPKLGAVRHYAPKVDNTSDPKKDIIRRTLWPPNLRTRLSTTGGWRADVGPALQYAIPSVQAHETIERAWKLHERHHRKRREAETERKWTKMKEAMDKLYEVDSHLYFEANKSEDPRARSSQERQFLKGLKGADLRAAEARIRGLFPRELKTPTDTPSRNGWNYEWKPFHRPM